MTENIHYPKIFISYRRKDTRGLVETLHKQLITFYANEVFIDKTNIPKGTLFAEVIRKNIKNCELFLPVFGPNWDTPNFIQRLKQPEDLVRQEMEWAIEYKKHIIPILIDRDSVPDNAEIPTLIKEQVLKRNGIILQGETELWTNEIRSCAELIEKYTGLMPNKPSNKTSEENKFFEQICYLNRETEYGKVKYPENEGQFMFAGYGHKKSGFKEFAQRCSLDILDETEIKTISWKQFENMPNTRSRKCELLDQIAKEMGIKVKGLNDEDKTKMFQARFRDKKYIFRCTQFSATSNNHNKGTMQEWWSIWQTLIGTDTNQNILVLLFTVPGWMFRLNLFGRFPKETKPDNIGTFGGVNKNDVLEWKEQYLDSSQYTVSDKQISKLFFMCWSKDFQDIEQGLLEAMKKAQLNNSDN